MKDIIDGKLYDTDEAEQIARWYNTADTQDFTHVEEVLYKTENGSYFLYGTGGPQSKYSRSVGSGQTAGGSEIKPMTEDEAYQWCEDENIDAEIILDEFPDRVESA